MSLQNNLRIVPRAQDYLDRKTGSRGEIFYDQTTNTLRLYNGQTVGGVSLARADLSNISNEDFALKIQQAGIESGSSISVSDQIPVDPSNGNLWLNTNNGYLYVYVNDGNSSQWIQPAVPNPILADVAYSGDYNDLINLPGAGDLTGYATEDYVDQAVGGITASSVGLGNVTNESKSTMFTNPAFTDSVTISNNDGEFVQVDATNKKISIGDEDPLNSVYLYVSSLDVDKSPMMVYAESHNNGKGVITTWFNDQYNYLDPNNLNPSDSFGGIMMASSRGGDFHVGKKYSADLNLEYWQVRNSFMTELLSVNWGGDLVLARKLETNGVVERFVNTIGPIAGNALTMNIKELANIYYLSDVTANFTVNISITDDQNGEPVSGKIYSATLIIQQGANAYGPTAWTINGSAVTLKWQGGASFSSTINVTDVINLNLIRRSDAWTVLASFTNYG